MYIYERHGNSFADLINLATFRFVNFVCVSRHEQYTKKNPSHFKPDYPRAIRNTIHNEFTVYHTVFYFQFLKTGTQQTNTTTTAIRKNELN